MLVPDVSNAKAVIVVFAMHGCPPCGDFLPRFMERVDTYAANGAPFHVWSPGEEITAGSILVLFYDAASKNDELQDLADRLGVTATPTTCLMTRSGVSKIEGSIPQDKIDQLLGAALQANR
jgi:Thioredoxin-like domain